MGKKYFILNHFGETQKNLYSTKNRKSDYKCFFISYFFILLFEEMHLECVGQLYKLNSIPNAKILCIHKKKKEKEKC